MPSPDDSTPTGVDNAFNLDFLARLAEQDEPLTAGPAAHGGVFCVRQMADGGYGLYRFWESPERDDPPSAVLQERSTAYLAAAFLPAVAEGRTLWSQDAEDAPGQTLYRYGEAIGRLRYRDPEMVEALNLSEAIASSPVLVAAFLTGVSQAALAEAGRILAREALSA